MYIPMKEYASGKTDSRLEFLAAERCSDTAPTAPEPPTRNSLGCFPERLFAELHLRTVVLELHESHGTQLQDY